MLSSIVSADLIIRGLGLFLVNAGGRFGPGFALDLAGFFSGGGTVARRGRRTRVVSSGAVFAGD